MGAEPCPLVCTRTTSLIVEAIADLHVEFARQVPVKSAEGETVVVEDALVGDIESSDRGSEAFTEILAQREIEGGVAGEVVALIGLVRDASFSVVEAGAVFRV